MLSSVISSISKIPIPRYEVSHAQTAVANFLNFTWGSNSLSSDALLLHFSATTPTPVDANTYTLVAGGDTWTFSGSDVQTRMVASSIEWTIPNGNVRGSANRMGLRRAGTLTSAGAGIGFTQVSDVTNVSQFVNQWPSTYSSEFRVGSGEIWARGNRIFVATRGITTPINTQLVLELNSPGNNSGEWQELTNAHVIKDWPASFNANDRFVLRPDEIYQTSTGLLYLRIGPLASITTAAIFTSETPTDSNTGWRRIDGAGGGGSTSSPAIIDTAGTPSLAMDVTAEEIRDLIGALDPTDFQVA